MGKRKKSSKNSKVSEKLTEEDLAVVREILNRSKVELQQIQEEEEDELLTKTGLHEQQQGGNTPNNNVRKNFVNDADPYTFEECEQLASGYTLIAEVSALRTWSVELILGQ
jgi:phage repressor protein C with HTH and peptisase S24 domain